MSSQAGSPVTAIAGTRSASPATGAARSSTRSFTAATARCLPRPPGPSSTAPPLKAISPIGPGGWPSSAGAGCSRRERSERRRRRRPSRDGEAVSVLIFRLGEEWLAFRTQTVAEVTMPRPVHRIPHRSNQVLVGLGEPARPGSALRVAARLAGRDCTGGVDRGWSCCATADRAETWAFAADEVVGVHRVPRSQWRGVPSTLVNPAVGFSQAVLSWNGRSIGLLDEQRVFTALRSLGP